MGNINKPVMPKPVPASMNENIGSNKPEEKEPTGKHTLPFKVQGTCFSKDRQTTLENAYEYLNEYNRPVFVDLVAEPENAYDRDAIALYIMYEDEFEKVGYIPHELTQYLHPLLKTHSLEFSVKNIRFQTVYLRVGFYLTINVTKAVAR